MIRKIFIVLTLITTITLTGCFEQEQLFPLLPEIQDPEDNEEDESLDEEDLEKPNPGDDNDDYLKVVKILSQLNLNESIDKDFELLLNVNDVNLTYKSNNEAITIQGNTAVVKQNIVDTNVVIEVIGVYNDVSVSKSFDMIVEALILNKPSDYSSIEVIDYISEKLYLEKYYFKQTTGESKNNGFLTATTQLINNKLYKYDTTSYLEAMSETTYSKLGIDSSFYHNAYFTSADVKYIHSDNVITSTNSIISNSRSDYKIKYGLMADEKNFSGYVINESTSTSNYIGFNNGIYSFHYILNTTTSCENMKIQMKEYGNLSEVSFSSIEVTINIDEEWNLISYSTKEVYKAKKHGVNVEMTQNLTTTITKFDINNPDLTLPDLSRFL